MIYFDKNKEAFANLESITNWGEIPVYSCSDEMFKEYQEGKYVWEDDELVLNPEWNSILLEEAKDNKIKENDTARDEALNQGVTYNNILFDSDTDQKANLIGAIFQMNDTDTIEWYGMNNYSLECTKADLMNIGGLITQLHSFCWTENARIKNAINEAQTIEEVNNIEIDYSRGE